MIGAIGENHEHFQKEIGHRLIFGLDKVCRELGQKMDAEKAHIHETMVAHVKTHSKTLVDECQRHLDAQIVLLKAEISQELANNSNSNAQRLLELQKLCSATFGKLGARIEQLETSFSGMVHGVNANFGGMAEKISEVEEKFRNLEVFCQNVMTDWMDVEEGDGPVDDPPPPLPP